MGVPDPNFYPLDPDLQIRFLLSRKIIRLKKI